jgi:hypothetical protein
MCKDEHACCVPTNAVLIPSSPVVALVGRAPPLPHLRAETSFRCLGGLQTEKLVPVPTTKSYAWMAVNIGMPLITNAVSALGSYEPRRPKSSLRVFRVALGPFRLHSFWLDNDGTGHRSHLVPRHFIVLKPYKLRMRQKPKLEKFIRWRVG